MCRYRPMRFVNRCQWFALRHGTRCSAPEGEDRQAIAVANLNQIVVGVVEEYLCQGWIQFVWIAQIEHTPHSGPHSGHHPPCPSTTHLAYDDTVFHHTVAHKPNVVLSELGFCSIQACTLKRQVVCTGVELSGPIDRDACNQVNTHVVTKQPVA